MTETDPLNQGIDEMISGIEKIVENGGYREKQEAAEIVHKAGYFKNFSDNSRYGEGFVRRLEALESRLREEVNSEDLPEEFGY